MSTNTVRKSIVAITSVLIVVQYLFMKLFLDLVNTEYYLERFKNIPTFSLMMRILFWFLAIFEIVVCLFIVTDKKEE